IAGIFQDLTINPTVANNFQFGNRMIVRASTTATTTAIGGFIRMIDNTALGNTVRGLEVQAYSGTNVQGTNTGIIAFGRTFGIQGITTGEAGGVSNPAGVYAELQNGTQGNAFRAYSSTSTSATLVQFFQETSAYTGTGLDMNFGVGAGSFTGNFMTLQRAGVAKFNINASGTTVIASSSAAAGASSTLTVCAQTNCTLSATSSASVLWVASVDGTTGTNSIVARGSITGNAADFAEWVPVAGEKNDYEAGDLLAIATSTSSSTELFIKTQTVNDPRLAGAISASAAFIAGAENGTEGKVVMALSGRISVKVNGENGFIKAGDLITASSKLGTGAKAIQPGRVLGMALESFDGISATSTGKVLTLINPHWYVPPVEITAGELQGGQTGTGQILNTYTFDPNTLYSFENLKVKNLTAQNVEVGTNELPSGITIYDTVTKNPYCIIMENGVLKSVPGKCGEGVTTGVIATSTALNANQAPPLVQTIETVVAETVAAPLEQTVSSSLIILPEISTSTSTEPAATSTTTILELDSTSTIIQEPTSTLVIETVASSSIVAESTSTTETTLTQIVTTETIATSTASSTPQ
ncbi:MAG: hypothetical protein AAB772_03250, partial [Patescibacteria group bacterium]